MTRDEIEAQDQRLTSLFMAVRLQAEGSDWRRDDGETLEQWVVRALKDREAMRREARTMKGPEQGELFDKQPDKEKGK